MRFAFILEEKAHFPVRCQCAVLEVTRSGFYAWCARPVAARTQDTQRLAVEALTMALAHRQPDPGLVHHSDRGSSTQAATTAPCSTPTVLS